MACLCRIRQAKVNNLFFQLKRSYFQVSTPRLSDHAAQNKIASSLTRRQILGVHGRSKGFFDIVRFFAAPVLPKPKEEKRKGPRLNEQIKADMVRLVLEEGHEVVPFHVAMARARSLNHDLVEVDPQAKPIVCKIMDYALVKYEQKMKKKERSKSKGVLTLRTGDMKEVRISPKIEQKDLQMKADATKKLMERGYRVKCMVLGKEEQNLIGLIERLYSLIEDVSYVETGPKAEKTQAYVIIRHIKFAGKKGGKGTFKSPADPARQKVIPSQSTGDPDLIGPDNDNDKTKQSKKTLPVSGHTEKPPALPSSSENRYDVKPGPDRAQNQTPDQPSHTEKPPALPNLSENRYNTRPGPDRAQIQMPGPPSSFGNRYMARPGPDRAQNQVPQVPDLSEKPPALPNLSENRYNVRPGPDRAQNQMPGPPSSFGNRYMTRPGPNQAQNQLPRVAQVPNPFEKPPALPNSSENRYSVRPSPDRAQNQMPGPPSSSGNRYMARPGPDRNQNQAPQVPDPSENRYSRQNVTPTPSKSYGIFSGLGKQQSGLKGSKPDPESSAETARKGER